MKDAIGMELQIGDAVLFTFSGSSSAFIGEIIGFTPKKVKIRYSSFNIETTKYPEQIYLFEQQDNYNKTHFPELFL